MAEQYSNSAKGTLAVGIDDTDTTITLDDTPGAYNFGYVGEGDFKRATITGADPAVFEIVYITGSDGISLDLTIERGQEGTNPLTWGIGSEISCRVTSGMLDTFLQQDANGVVRSRPGRPSNTFVVNGRVSGSGEVMLAGYHALPLVTARPTTNTSAQDRNMTRESVGGSLFVDLGDSIPTWVANTYYEERSIVRPTTPNGYVYLLETFSGGGSAQSSVEPDWGFGDSVVESTIGGTPNGSWIPLPDPLVVNLAFVGSNKLLLSEVGFVCMGYDTVTTPPSVSVGVPGDLTRFANAVSLTGLTAADKVWRVPVTTDELVSGLVFTLDTEATGSLTGRFYWRGAFIETLT